MAIKKIPCGGWLYDDESITFEDGVMKVIGGGGEGGIVFVNLTIDVEQHTIPSADKTVEELLDAYLSGRMVATKLEDDNGITSYPLNAVYTSKESNTIMLQFGHVTYDSQEGPVYMITGTHTQSGDEWTLN